MNRPHIAVVGAGIAGLVCAYECARAGAEVTLLEASGRVGGSIARARTAGLSVDVGAESFATRGGGVAKLVNELGLSREVAAPNPAGAWLRLPGRSIPLPHGMLGIPGDLASPEVVLALGADAAVEAARRDAAPVTDTLPDTVGALVRQRMGDAVADLLVSPVTGGVYSADADLLQADVIAPGLRDATRAEGSLAAAVRTLRAGAAARAKAGSAVLGLTGGMTRLVDALSLRLRERHAWTRLHTRVTGIAHDPSATPAAGSAWTLHTDGGGTVQADAVIVAADGTAARTLLAGVSASFAGVCAAEWAPDTGVRIVTLVVDSATLDAAPRGTGLLVADAPGTGVAAKALTHSTAKWPWLAHAAGPGRHVLRLSYGRAGGSAAGSPRPGAPATPDDAARPAASTPAALPPDVGQALADAGVLLGVPLAADALRGSAVTTWHTPAPAALPGAAERVAAVRAAADALPTLAVTGAWLSGTGLASVIPDARRVAARILGTFSRIQ